MNIIFSPEYLGNLYIQNPRGPVMMDTMVVNVIGLVNMLELRLGLHYDEQLGHERMAHYYDAVSQYMKSHPNNVMAKSFDVAGLNTAKAMLAWRDELRSAEWDIKGKDISERLKVLIEVEEIFKKLSGVDIATRLQIVTDKISSQKLNYKEMEIELPCAAEFMKPAITKLLDAMAKQGAKLTVAPSAKEKKNNLSAVRKFFAESNAGKIKLDAKDESLLIYQFPDEKSANEYLSFYDVEADVWINADNKQMDNWLSLMHKPLTGSCMADCSPQLTQMFVMGIGLFAQPLNVISLVEWFNMPIHPLDSYFRRILAETIVAQGGFYNEACKEVIAKFVNGDYVYLDEEHKQLAEEEQMKYRREDIEKRKKRAEVFLPTKNDTETILTESVREFVKELSAWANQRAHLMAESADNQLWVEQLHSVAAMCDAMNIMLGTVDGKEIDYKTIDSWMSSIYQKGAYTNAIAEQGCRIVVDAPSKIASVAKRTIWMGVEGDGSSHLECSFLYPSEKKALIDKKHITPWDEQKQRQYIEQMTHAALRMTEDQLIIVVCERRGGEPVQKHPFMVRLEQQIENFEAIVRHPKINKKDTEKVDFIESGGVAAEINFDNAEAIKWPDHMSPTTVDTLVEYPLDYMLERLLNITPGQMAQMSDVKTTSGNVAHAVIEALFAPQEGKSRATVSEIAKRLENEFETVYAETINAKGSILQLTENRLTEKLFHEQLRTSLDTLLEIMQDNKLSVTGCEHRVESDMNFGLPKAKDKDGNEKKRDMSGMIDMTLEDENHKSVVIDFKWTSSRSYHRKLLEANRSTQLELYRYMLSREKKDTVDRVAYFLMPEGQLYSKDTFVGRHCTHIDPANDNDIVEQLRNSVIYRKRQIDNGVVETNGTFEELQYVKDTEAMNLYPLVSSDEGLKKENLFTKYGLFNA